VNPETGRTSHVGMSTEQEATLGLQTYQQVLSQSPSITSGQEFEMGETGGKPSRRRNRESGQGYDWQVSLIQDGKVNAFCLPGERLSFTPASFRWLKTRRLSRR